MKNFFEKILNNATGSRSDCLKKEMKDAYKKVIIIIVITLASFAVFLLYPIYVYVNESRLVPLMRIEFPFVDQSYMKGYLIRLAIMLLLAVLGVSGSVAFDILTLMLFLEYGSLVTQLGQDLNNYHEMWKNKEAFSEHSRQLLLRTICLKYQDINE